MRSRLNLIGQRFGNLVVLNETSNCKRPRWDCICDCGNIKSIDACHLRSGHTKTCGCSLFRIKVNVTHGMSKTRLARIYNDMIQRCTNSHRSRYKNYGGRGISVCSEWLNNSSSFYEWALSNGYKEELEIDRENVNGNYEPLNCRWVTKKVQSRNKRTNVFVTFNGRTQTIADWCDEIGISQGAFYARKKYGWSTDKIISTPILTKWSRHKK